MDQRHKEQENEDKQIDPSDATNDAVKTISSMSNLLFQSAENLSNTIESALSLNSAMEKIILSSYHISIIVNNNPLRICIKISTKLFALPNGILHIFSSSNLVFISESNSHSSLEIPIILDMNDTKLLYIPLVESPPSEDQIDSGSVRQDDLIIPSKMVMFKFIVNDICLNPVTITNNIEIYSIFLFHFTPAISIGTELLDDDNSNILSLHYCVLYDILCFNPLDHLQNLYSGSYRDILIYLVILNDHDILDGPSLRGINTNNISNSKDIYDDCQENHVNSNTNDYTYNNNFNLINIRIFSNYSKILEKVLKELGQLNDSYKNRNLQ